MIVEDIIKKFWVKVAFVFGLGGFVVSFLLVLVSGGGFPEIIIRPVLSSVFLSTVWIVCYFLIVKFVPDILGVFGVARNEKEGGESVEQNEDFNFELNIDEKKPLRHDAGKGAEFEKISEDLKLETESVDEETETQKGQKKVKRKAGSDEIMVEGVPMKKDPELMAKAIKHILDTDKE